MRNSKRIRHPLFIIDAHPVDVCRPVRAGRKTRLGGLAQFGYCSALERNFYGVKEHLIFTPDGMLAFSLQIPGNRHDVNGLYALLKTAFQGTLIGDNAYWPETSKRMRLIKKGIIMYAAVRKNWKTYHPEEIQSLIDNHRRHIERFTSNFNEQFHAGRTRCRNKKHYIARRLVKAFAHNASRFISASRGLRVNSMQHFHLAA